LAAFPYGGATEGNSPIVAEFHLGSPAVLHGVSAAEHLAVREFTYPSYECDCPRGKTGFPTRHIRNCATPSARNGTNYRIEILPKAEFELPAECPTWRPSERVWTRRGRSWPGVPSTSVEDAPARVRPAPRPARKADFPPRSSAVGLIPYATSAEAATGRMRPDGPIVTQVRLSGRGWYGIWTDGKFDHARWLGAEIGVNELKARVRSA
jgi:hypothetical protein